MPARRPPVGRVGRASRRGRPALRGTRPGRAPRAPRRPRPRQRRAARTPGGGADCRPELLQRLDQRRVPATKPERYPVIDERFDSVLNTATPVVVELQRRRRRLVEPQLAVGLVEASTKPCVRAAGEALEEGGRCRRARGVVRIVHTTAERSQSSSSRRVRAGSRSPRSGSSSTRAGKAGTRSGTDSQAP